MSQSALPPLTKIGAFSLSASIPQLGTVTVQESIGPGWTHGIMIVRNPALIGMDQFLNGGLVFFDTGVVSMGDVESTYAMINEQPPPDNLTILARPRVYWNNANGGDRTTDDFLGTQKPEYRIRMDRAQIVGDQLEMQFANSGVANTVNMEARFRLFRDAEV